MPNQKLKTVRRSVALPGDLVDDALSRGANVLWGGSARPELGPNFFEPTVISAVDASMKLFQEETFGPILAIQAVKDPQEAIMRANDSSFALASSIWTKNKARGMALATELRAGAVMVNDAISYFGIAEAPHGGCGTSGWGRTHGQAGLLEMVQMKYIDVDGLPRSEKPWWYRYGPDLERAADAFLQFEFSRGIGAKLTVVSMEGWIRGDWFDSTGKLWIDPSPNMRSLDEAVLYPGIGMIEATNISVGRGTDTPFEVVGAPWMDPIALAQFLNAREISGVRFIPVYFTPNSSNYANEKCGGVNIMVTDRNALDAPELGAEVASALQKLYPNQYKIGRLDSLMVSKSSFDAIAAGEDPRRVEEEWQDGIERFEVIRSKYLLY